MGANLYQTKPEMKSQKLRNSRWVIDNFRKEPSMTTQAVRNIDLNQIQTVYRVHNNLLTDLLTDNRQ